MDKVTKLCAAGRWSDAEVLARERLEAIEERASAAGLPPLEGPELASYQQEIALPRARAVRQLVEVLVDGDRAEAATEHMMDLRRLYRPFMSDHGCAAEYHLTVAGHAACGGSSRLAEDSLQAALDHAATSADHRMLHARALRLKAHLSILKWEPDEGVALLEEALGLLDSTTDTGALLRVQYLLSLAEVHYGREDPAKSERCVSAALDALANYPLVNDDEIVDHCNRRAELVRAVNEPGE